MTTQLTVATLNIRGLPLKGTRVAGRFAAIAAELDSSKIDLICLQEVFDYYHLRLLRQGMPSFTQVAYRPSLAGPRGGLVTLSRQPLSDTAYIKLPQPSRRSGLPVRARVNALHSGLLAVHLAGSRIRVLNVHPAANTDGDWSEHNRFRQLQGDQLTALGQVVKANMATTVVCGDFNVARISTLHHALQQQTGLRDAFDGQCPPTFHAEYLPPGSTPHCIDFILITDPIEVNEVDLLFAEERHLPTGPGYLSDHIGLLAQLEIPAPTT